MPAAMLYSLTVKDASPSGVLNTLESRLEAMQSVLPGSYGVCFYRGKDPESGRYERIRFVKVRAKSRELSHLLFPVYLWKWIRATDAKPRHVVVRYHFPSPLFGLLFCKRGFTLVSEHHTNLEANLSTLPGAAGKILPIVAGILRPTTDLVMDGKIGLTREILGREAGGPSILVMGNGINPQDSSNQKYRVFDGRTLDAVTIISADWQWNGLGRMIASMENWADQNPQMFFNLTVIGPPPVVETTASSAINLSLVGTKTSEELSMLVGGFNFAFSTLGTWQMGLDEACPLKSRTYIGLGLPYISGYIDPDLDDSRLFVARFPNSPEAISWVEVQPFLDLLARSQIEVLADLSQARAELAHLHKSARLEAFLVSLEHDRKLT